VWVVAVERLSLRMEGKATGVGMDSGVRFADYLVHIEDCDC
jgi:hypothetical protein